MLEYDFMMAKWSGQRLFGLTTAENMGCFPRGTIAGDLVCILWGGQTPYVLRPCGNGRYLLIGECYVHGFTDGEAMRIHGVEDEECTIQ